MYHGVCVCVYLLRCSSKVRKVIRLGSGRERSRCIMQFSLAAGSDRAAKKHTTLHSTTHTHTYTQTNNWHHPSFASDLTSQPNL